MSKITRSAASEPAPPKSTTEPVTRVCRKCSTQSTAPGDFCPNCGARYAKRRKPTKRRLLKFGIPILLLLAGAGVGIALKIRHDDNVTKHHAAERAAARHAAAQRAATRAKEKAAVAAAERQFNRHLAQLKRKTLVDGLQSAVKKDAEKDVTSGVLTGPILSVDCQPATAADQTATPIAAYTCLAVTKLSGDGTESGYRFSSTINLNTDSYTWHLGG